MTTMTDGAFDLSRTYVHLGPGATATPLATTIVIAWTLALETLSLPAGQRAGFSHALLPWDWVSAELTSRAWQPFRCRAQDRMGR